MASIYEERIVVKRIARKRNLLHYLSSGSLAAAAMLAAALIALIVANSPAYNLVLLALEQPLEIGIGTTLVSISLENFVNDFLMAIFFLLVGIELKYEVTIGQLKKPRQALLPMMAAVGGVCVPALIYLVINTTIPGTVSTRGWAIPIATDIAFALGVVSLLKNKVKPATKVFFQTLAIMDDILAIVVIALFYGQTPNIAWCGASLLFILLLVCLNRAHIYKLAPYVVVGLCLWVCMYNSGIHATLAGIILAFALPVRSDVNVSQLGQWLSHQAAVLDDTYDDDHHILGQHDFTQGSIRVERVMHHVTPPLQRMEQNISIFVSYAVLPLFAFVNAELHIVGENLNLIVSDPVAIGVYLGAVFGKPIGIILVTLALSKIGLAPLPKTMDNRQVVVVGLLGGIGFTMSILISGLAYGSAAHAIAAKCAILLASLTSAVLGLVFMHLSARPRKAASKKATCKSTASRNAVSRKAATIPSKT